MTPLGSGAQASTGASEVLLGFGAPVPGDTPARHEVGGEHLKPTPHPGEIGNIGLEPLTRRGQRTEAGTHGEATWAPPGERGRRGI